MSVIVVVVVLSPVKSLPVMLVEVTGESVSVVEAVSDWLVSISSLLFWPFWFSEIV